MSEPTIVQSKSASHTPGPWKTIRSPHGRDYLCVQIGPDEQYTTLELLPGDARLIAAAPDLLDALKRASRELEQYVDLQQKLDYIEYAASTQKELDGVNAAIANAEGSK